MESNKDEAILTVWMSMVLLEITVYGYGEAPLLNIQEGCFFYLPLIP